MGEEIAISLKNVSKCYKRYAHPVDRLKEVLLPGKSRAQEFWALGDINLEVPKGETLGIIGQNGSGKSTLLQIIAGTLTPTTGEVLVNGRVSALLELGSGFNPEFTGRQNVFFNGQILGLSQAELEAKFDDIAAFAEIGDFIEQPVKTYSSGMAVRLAFAVIANTEPKILIVDEALSVGDAKFQARCMKRIRQMKDQGVTVLFVSHDSGSVKMLCKSAVLMNYGRILEIGAPKEVVNHYIALLSSNNSEVEIEYIKSDSLSEPDYSLIKKDEDKVEPDSSLLKDNSNEVKIEYLNNNAFSNLDHSPLKIDEDKVEPDSSLLKGNSNEVKIEYLNNDAFSNLDHSPLKIDEDKVEPDSSLLKDNSNEVKIEYINNDTFSNLDHSLLKIDEDKVEPDFSLLKDNSNEVKIEYLNNDALVLRKNSNISLHRHGNRLAIIKNVRILDLDEKEIEKIETGAIFQIRILMEAQAELSNFVVGISITNLMGVVIYGTNTKLQDVELPELNNNQQLTVNFQVPCYLNKGVYTVTVGIHSEEGLSYDWIDELIVFEVSNTIFCDGLVDLKSIINLI